MPDTNNNDHDLLIAVSTKMDMVLSGQQQFITQWGQLLQRLTAIEIEQGRHDTEIHNMEEEIAELRKKVTVADAINAAIAAVAGVIGFFFGQH